MAIYTVLQELHLIDECKLYRKMSRMNHKNGTNFLEMNRLIQI